MKAYRKYGNTFIQFTVTLSPTGEPLLPHDATLNDKPSGVPDHRLRIISGDWVVIPEETYILTFEQRKREKSNQVNTWKHKYMDSFLIYNGRPFDFDDKSRNNINGAYLGWRDFDDPTEAWKDANNSLYPVKDFKELTSMSKVFLKTYKERFTICAKYEAMVNMATNEDELNSIVTPYIPTLNEINRHLTYGTPLPTTDPTLNSHLPPYEEDDLVVEDVMPGTDDSESGAKEEEVIIETDPEEIDDKGDEEVIVEEVIEDEDGSDDSETEVVNEP